MVFSSFTFIAFFLPIVIFLYFVSSSPRWKNGVLLVASLLFYAWGEPRFMVMMVLSILVNYIAAGRIDKSRSKKRPAHVACDNGFVRAGFCPHGLSELRAGPLL